MTQKLSKASIAETWRNRVERDGKPRLFIFGPDVPAARRIPKYFLQESPCAAKGMFAMLTKNIVWLSAIVALCVCVANTQAATNTFTGGAGTLNYATDGNWSLGSIPSGSNAEINTIGVTLADDTAGIANPAELWIGNGGSAGSLEIKTGGTLTNTSWLCIGRGGSASAGVSTLTVSGGTLTHGSGSNFVVGDNGGAPANIVLSGGTINSNAGSFDVANASSSIVHITQSGGALNISTGGDSFKLAAATGSTASYDMSGGTLLASGNSQLGSSGTGTMTQTAGDATFKSWLSIGRHTGSTGIYDISGGTLTATTLSNIVVGESGTGTLDISGTASLTVNGIRLTQNSTGSGTVNMSGGELAILNSISSTTGIYATYSDNAAFNFSGGEITVAGNCVGFNENTTWFTAAKAGYVYEETYNAGANTTLLHFVPVPEPGTLAMCLAGAVGLIAYAWRKRR